MAALGKWLESVEHRQGPRMQRSEAGIRRGLAENGWWGIKSRTL